MVIKALCRCWDMRNLMRESFKTNGSDDGEAFEAKHLFVFVRVQKEPVFLQISIFQLATGEAGILFWCQELQAGDLEQLSVHLARSLVFSNPNVVLGEESPPSSLRFPKSVVLIHSGHQFFFCPLLQALRGGWEISWMEPCCRLNAGSAMAQPGEAAVLSWSHPCLENNHSITSCQGEECPCHQQQRVPQPSLVRG